MGSGKPLEHVHEALRQSLFSEAIGAASDISLDELAEEQQSHLMDLLLAAAAGLSDGSGAELEAYDLVVDIGNVLSQRDEAYAAAIQLKTNSALFNKGVVLAQIGRWEDAIAAYDELVRRTGGARELGLRENAVRALFNKGASLRGLDRREEAIDVYDELIRRFASDTEPSFDIAVSKAYINKGVALAELNRLDEAIAVLDEVVSRWGNSTDPHLRERISKALLNKASALVQLSHREAALATYEEILMRFGSASDPELKRQVEIARHGKEDLETNLN
jgi:tetratricopeptide (TPR) repeat protein